MKSISEDSSPDNYLTNTINALGEPIVIFNNDSVIVFASKSFKTVIKYPQDIYLNSIKDFWPEFIPSLVSDKEEFSTFIKSYDAEELPVKVKLYSLGNDKKYGALFILKILNVGSSSALAEQFHNQRLQMLGIMAGGVAHDFNNILTGILGHTSYLRAVLPEKGEHIESLDAIEGGAKKSSTITQQILKFARSGENEEIQVCDFKQVISSTCTLLRAAIPRMYNLRYQIPDIPVPIMGIETKIAQVVANLVINARDAIQEGGNIEVGLETVEDQQRLKKVFKNRPLSKARYIRLYVIDDGHGMNENVQKRVFEPFFTTKGEQGTGLGLPMVASIVNLFKGAIEISSKENIGTSVSVYFPIYEVIAKKEVLKAENNQKNIVAQKIKILVVDDEYPVRNVIELSLKYLNYDVQTAASGEEALDFFNSSESCPFDLVILDMLMPIMSGDQVFEKMRSKFKDLNVLIISGYASNEMLERVLDGGAKGFIQKPFTIEELSKKIKECLN